jgi:tetrapyrrole methylase family protein/MazG family protein
MSENAEAIERLIEVMDRLLGPGGCPWDREQSHESLKRYLIEESYEVIEAIDEKDMKKLQEELGDLLLQVVFHSALAEREGYFDFADVVDTVKEKMINRHPHVFGTMELNSSDDVLNKWEGFKKKEGKKNLLEGIPRILPALMRAMKMQEKAARVGFDWPEIEGALEKVREEAEELCMASNPDEVKEEMGDLFFALVNISRMKNVEPEEALQACNDKFARRLLYIEEKLKKEKQQFEDLELAELDRIWEEAKTKGL